MMADGGRGVAGSGRAALGAAIIGLALGLGLAAPAWPAGTDAADATALPMATQRVPASAEECAVWRREQSFAESVARHDKKAFAAHLDPATIFNAGSVEADRGRADVEKNWTRIIEGTDIVLRWRPGIVDIGGNPDVAISRGPYILQTKNEGATVINVGFYQTIWSRDPKDSVWRVLFDGGASSLTRMADRAAAETWVRAQPMSDCAAAGGK